MIFNLGNVVGLLRSINPPIKPYVLWGKILDPQTPFVVELRIYKGSGDISNENNWKPLMTLGGTVVINWQDVEGKPLIFSKAEIVGGELLFLTDDNQLVTKVTLADIFDGIDVDFLQDYIDGKT